MELRTTTEDQLPDYMGYRTFRAVGRGRLGPPPKWEWRWLADGDKHWFEPESRDHKRYVRNKLKTYVEEYLYDLEWEPVRGPELERYVEREMGEGKTRKEIVDPVRVRVTDGPARSLVEAFKASLTDGQLYWLERGQELTGEHDLQTVKRVVRQAAIELGRSAEMWASPDAEQVALRFESPEEQMRKLGFKPTNPTPSTQVNAREEAT